MEPRAELSVQDIHHENGFPYVKNRTARALFHQIKHPQLMVKMIAALFYSLSYLII